MKNNQKIDDEIATLVLDALVESIPDEGLRKAAADAVIARLSPAYGAAAMRRRTISDMRAAFKEGFQSGQILGKFARWHSTIWSMSRIATSLKEAPGNGADARSKYARYNDW